MLVDVSTVAASAIKQQIVLKQVHPPVITAVWRAMSPGTAQWKPNPSRATSVVRKVISLVTALTRRPLETQEAVAAAASPEEEPLQVLNAIAVAKLDTLRVRALMLPAEEEEEEDTAEDTEEVALEAAAAEARPAILAVV